MDRMDELMQRVAICEAFGWTYEEYDDQPAHFIAAIKHKMTIDNKRMEKKMKHG